jgi:L-threonylcarbamoyladenylate synthase
LRRLGFKAPEDLAAAVEAVLQVLDQDGVVVLPTETFYGLGASPHHGDALAKVYAMKGRPSGLPIPILCADWNQVEGLVVVPEAHRGRLQAAWPGPLTAVMPCSRPLAAAADDTLAVRIPGQPLLRSLLARVGPLTGTSANRHGEAPSSGLSAALDSLLTTPHLVLDGGVTPGGRASTIVDLTRDPPAVLRRGVICW